MGIGIDARMASDTAVAGAAHCGSGLRAIGGTTRQFRIRRENSVLERRAMFVQP